MGWTDGDGFERGGACNECGERVEEEHHAYCPACYRDLQGWEGAEPRSLTEYRKVAHGWPLGTRVPNATWAALRGLVSRDVHVWLSPTGCCPEIWGSGRLVIPPGDEAFALERDGERIGVLAVVGGDVLAADRLGCGCVTLHLAAGSILVRADDCCGFLADEAGGWAA